RRTRVAGFLCAGLVSKSHHEGRQGDPPQIATATIDHVIHLSHEIPSARILLRILATVVTSQHPWQGVYDRKITQMATAQAPLPNSSNLMRRVLAHVHRLVFAIHISAQ